MLVLDNAGIQLALSLASTRNAYTASSGTDIFGCLDGSKQIPFAAVNDDYCDCPDGSDEPGTPACETGFFHCLNADHIGADIPTSRVNDGICDPQCCDGSDEYLGYVKCHNNCTEIGATYRKEVLAKRRVVAEGEKIAREYAVFGAKSAADRTAEISILTNKIEKLDKKIKDLQDLKTAAEKFAELHADVSESAAEGETATSSTETSARQSKCCSQKSKCMTMLDEQIGGTLMVQDRLEFLQEGAYHIDNVEAASRDKDPVVAAAYDAYRDYKLTWAPEDGEEDEADKTMDPPTVEGDGAPVVSRDCCTKVEECKKKVEAEQDKFLRLSDKLEALLNAMSPLAKAKPKSRREDDWVRRAYEKFTDYKLQFRGEKLPPVQDLEELDKEAEEEEQKATAPNTAEEPAASSSPHDDSCAPAADVLASAWTDPKQVVKCAPVIVSKYAVSFYDTLSVQLKKTLRRVTSGSSAVPPPGGADVGKVAARLLEAEASRTEATTKLAELKRLADIDFGPAGVWEKLYRTCVETDTAEYTYEICILDRAVQKPKNGGVQTSLGTFKRWGVRDQAKATAENAHHAMMYEDGDRCWNGPARSVEVTVECGLETKLLSVVEMSKCEYDARLVSPAVCDLSKLDVLPPAWHEHNEL
ncbi:hypothetical protein HDU86_006037 [Geranomyces michiganensis]|nr:hypothetical protein HDU86_006037 [Geranomyces michiganensis]